MTHLALIDSLASRVLVLDGAMGTMLLAHPVTERDARGDRFRSHSTPLARDLDVLSLTQPALVSSIHHRYLESGADLITTNSFQANALSQAAYGLGPTAAEMALAAARLARRAADDWSSQTPAVPRFVAGSLGPVPRGANVAHGWARVQDAYREQATALLEGGSDLLLLETMTSLEEAARAAAGARDALASYGRERALLVSFSPTVSAGDLARAPELRASGIGINCASIGAGLATTLAAWTTADGYVTCHPSAGLPVQGRYTVTPDDFAAFARGCVERGLLNIVGGCCGTTPAHTHALAEAVRGARPRPIVGGPRPRGTAAR